MSLAGSSQPQRRARGLAWFLPDTEGAAVVTEEQERLLRLLAAELRRLRSMPPPEMPVRFAGPLPALEALVGISVQDVRRALGEPDLTEPAADDGRQTWHYDFSRRPPRYRGGGLLLGLRLGADAACLGARWLPQR